MSGASTGSVFRWIVARSRALSIVYLAGMIVWAVLSAALGDRTWWLFVANALAVYLFVPLPLVLITALLTRRRGLALGFVIVLAIGLARFGGLFAPNTTIAAGDRALTVMTYNILGFNRHPERVVAAIQASGADVVSMQELSPEVAAAIARDLRATYPYQILDPQPGVEGLGLISRYPLARTDDRLPGPWIGTPIVAAIDLDGSAVTIVDAHPFSTNPGWPADMERTIRIREQQAAALAAFAETHAGPLVIALDFNATDQSAAYATITAVLRDAWREAGWGLGHTFPGAASEGSSRPRLLGVAVPMWLVRIDYVFHSPDLRAAAAWIGPWDGFSDHRPVVARLVLPDR